MDAPRRVIITALLKQEQGGYANLVLAHALSAQEKQLSARDRAFISAVFYGTVERQITLDFMLQKFLAKPIAKLDGEVRAILRSGLYQACFLKSVPVSAAVNEAVKLVRAFGKTSAAGMVNAVLRKASAVNLQQETYEDDVQRLCVTYSVSRPIATLLCEKLPEHAQAILEASFVQPDVCVCVNTLRAYLQEIEQDFAQQGIVSERGTVPGSLYIKSQGDLAASALFQEGKFYVQGEASQLACHALSPQPGETVLDLCAAPGGKSMTLAQSMQNQGVLYSCDAAENRLALIRSAFLRTGITCAQVIHNDASVYREDFPKADAVLCDVPCSGLGILSKKPDIRAKSLDGLSELIQLQSRILRTAARYVKPGGRLVYSTCTINPDENQSVVQSFLKEDDSFIALAVPDVPGGAIMQDHMVTLLPYLSKTDGFFVALLQKKR